MAKFMDLTPKERYELIGKLIDAMVYDDQAVADVQNLVQQFEESGKVRSKFYPTIKTEEDGND